MSRRGRVVIAMSIGSLMSVASCSEPSLPDSTFEGEVIIVGAGASGLYAAYLLDRAGVSCRILEASDRIGGRLGKVEGFADFPIDEGAQWLHGRKSLVADLCREQGIAFRRDNSSVRYWFEGSLVRRLPKNPFSLAEDSSAADISLSEFAAQKGFDASYDSILAAAAGDFGAAPSDLSVKWTGVEGDKWSSGNADYKFEGTYFDVIAEHIAAPILNRVELNEPVVSVDYSGERIQVKTRNGTLHQCDRVVVTVPLTVLQDEVIEFTPVLPKEKTEAFSKLGMGPGMKVFLKFRKKFFQGLVIGGKACALYLDESVGKRGKDAVMLAFVMGDQAAAFTTLPTEDAIVKTLLEELDEIYEGQASEHFVDARVIDWSTRPFIGGAYSYPKVGAGKDVRTVAARPVKEQVYFAGEAMNRRGHPSTVHGAMESALDAVRDLLESP
ncbi:MAG: NAD(P)/FAD-dependent oxidoreductase [Verrucomicrobiota bacterium]